MASYEIKHIGQTAYLPALKTLYQTVHSKLNLEK